MSEHDYIQRPVDEAYQRGVEGMGTQGPRVSAGEWFEAIARMFAQGLAMRGGVEMPGGIAPKRDIQANLNQVRQGHQSLLWSPRTKPGLVPYRSQDVPLADEVATSRMSDTFRGPVSRTYQPLLSGAERGKRLPWTPTHERRALWEQMLGYLMGTSRQ